MKWSQSIDNEIKCALSKEAEKMQGEQQLYDQIREEIYVKGREKNMRNMKMPNRRISKKVILVGSMTIILAAGTILAAEVRGWDMKLLNFYEQYPTQEQIKEESGFSPKFVEELPGGYTFMMASTHKGELIDAYNNVSDEGNEFVLRYFAPGEEDEMHAIAFFATDIKEHYGSSIRKTTQEYKGITLEFADWKDKYVSGDYKLTEEEQKHIDAGELFIRETEDEYWLEKGTKRTQEMSWWEDDIVYSLLSANNHQFTQEEFAEMAKVIIDSRNVK